MSFSFWNTQDNKSKERYIHFLKLLGNLSNLFSESSTPFLYYRAHENLFCKYFHAKNLARGDVAFDAIKDNMGIGLKTFLHGNGRTFQKIAEFNAESSELRVMQSDLEIIYRISELRNKRLEFASNLTEANNLIYHTVTREYNRMNIVETPMEYIDLNSIELLNKQHLNTIQFKDRFNEYSFSLSKNTLLKRFSINDNIVCTFPVKIAEDPFSILDQISFDLEQKRDGENEFIILPLYSPSINRVPEKSGLNQWNAGGRIRHPNEIYIPIPSWIHIYFKGFFEYSLTRTSSNSSAKYSKSFKLELPNGNIIDAKIAQQGGKALMSNPNKILGEWLLREVLGLPIGTLITMELLKELEVDSVKVTKLNNEYYYLDFMEYGSYADFHENNFPPS